MDFTVDGSAQRRSVTSGRRRRVRAGLLPAALFSLLSVQARAQSLDWQLVTETDKSALNYAVQAGHEEQLPLYACRVKAGQGVQTGRFRSDFTGCHVGYAGQELSVIPFEVLAPAWQDAANGTVPAGSFLGGQRTVVSPKGMFGLAASYPCRAAYQGGTQVGTVVAGDRGCSFGFGGRQVTETHYQVLWHAPWMQWAPGIIHQLPLTAVAAGTEAGEVFYICRASDATGLHAGKIKQSSPGCSIGSDGKEIVTQLFSVLVPRWLESNSGMIPRAALPAGVEREDAVYLCRTQIRGSMQIGKINEQLASCRVGMMGGEIPSMAYEVLSAR